MTSCSDLRRLRVQKGSGGLALKGEPVEDLRLEGHLRG